MEPEESAGAFSNSPAGSDGHQEDGSKQAPSGIQPATGAEGPGAAIETVVRFSVFELRARTGELRREGALVRLRNQPFRLLVVLASRPGELVTREELQRTLWAEDELVDAEQGLNYCVREIRAALGDSAEAPRFVQTLPRRGYRFIADVRAVEPPGRRTDSVRVAHAPAPASARNSRTSRLGALGIAAAIALVALPGLRVAGAGASTSEAARRVPASSEAYVEFLRGRSLWNQRDASSLHGALSAFRSSIALQDDFAPAWVGLADAYNVLADHGHIPAREGWVNAKAAADRALSLDPRLPEAWASVAMYRAMYEWNWPQAQAAFERSLELNPDQANARHWYGLALASRGRWIEACAQLERAAALDPLSVTIRGNLALTLARAGRSEAALREIRVVVDLRPRWSEAHVWEGRIHAAAGRIGRAVESLERALAIEATPRGLAYLTMAYALAGRKDDARVADSRLARFAERPVQSYYRALSAWWAGDADRAFDELNRAFDERSSLLRQLRPEGEWRGIERDARFARLAALLERGSAVALADAAPAADTDGDR